MAAELGYKEGQYLPPCSHFSFSSLYVKVATLISIHRFHSPPFYSLLMTISRQEVPPKELWEKDIANYYEQGAYRAGDGRKDSTTYVAKTLEDQNCALNRYET
jgi:hypothetical protein